MMNLGGPVPTSDPVLTAFQDFAENITRKMATPSPGEPEDQLRGPFESFMEAVGSALSKEVVSTGESMLPGRLGKPDYAVHSGGLLAGYAELKAPGVGVNPNRFTGHNKDQWKRFSCLPNLLYSDGNAWGLYRDGERVRTICLISGDVTTDGRSAVTAANAEELLDLLTDFLSWEPTIPTNLADLASLIAPLCRLLRDDVRDAMQDETSPLVRLAEDWRRLLFPDATDDEFSDAYAQTVTYALLLARGDGADTLDLGEAERALAAEHSLLARALQVLTDPAAQIEISASLRLLQRVTSLIIPDSISSVDDPWLYFYEDFLAAYDPNLRKQAGAYYTPVEVVHAQVRMIDDMLIRNLGKPLGFAAADVVTLDPAVGTGTYLLGVIDQALGRIESEQGPGAVGGQASARGGPRKSDSLLRWTPQT